MLGKELLTYVDHTLLRPIATWDEIKVICEDALAYHTASVCIPPDFVASAHNAYPNLNICTVIGFPLGYQTTESKVAEANSFGRSMPSFSALSRAASAAAFIIIGPP